ncbi:MAG: hypothetical protein H7Y09_07130, partial [Chitinophagaceae bacterium]|nr:hypothetical protein [Anaerolineae bacterium]
MSTRRFTDEFSDPDPFSKANSNSGSVELPDLSDLMQSDEPASAPAQRPASLRQSASGQPPRSAGNSAGNAHLPRTLTQVINDANEKVMRGDLDDYVPMPTGFDPLDGYIGGGLRKTELVLLGGAQGIGKTIATLQIARNIAARTDQYAFYLSYEHTETHLMHRLLCMESLNPPEIDLSRGIKLR